MSGPILAIDRLTLALGDTPLEGEETLKSAD